MATMVNLIPVETKPKVAQQGTATKDNTKKNDQPAVPFAKVLNNQTDKNGKDDANTKDDTNAKDNTATQLMAAMIGMAVPAVATTMTSNPNQSSERANSLDANDKGQLSEVASNGLTTGMDTSPSQLAALLAKMTDTNASADSNQVGELPQVKLQTVLQELVQGKQLLGQVQTPAVSAEKVDLTANKALLATVASFATADNSNGVAKNNSASQVDSKKTTQAQVTTGTTTTAGLAELVGTVDVKHVTAPQSAVNVVDPITSDSNENTVLLGGKAQLSAENILVDETVKDTDVFASLLNQQVKNENQVIVSDTKQVQQPVKDPYNIASQIVEQARVVTGQKNTEMIIQLKPEHLGELTLKVTVESGVVSASFHSNNSEVRNVIEASLPQLKQELTNQGLKIENVGVYAGLGDFFSNGQQRESQQQSGVKVHNKKIEEEFLEALESTSATESTSDGSGVDYRI